MLFGRLPDSRHAPLGIGEGRECADDQAKALKFYTEVLGFVKKIDSPPGEFRRLTVVSPAAPDGVELLEPDAHPASRLRPRRHEFLQSGSSGSLDRIQPPAPPVRFCTHETHRNAAGVGLARAVRGACEFSSR